MGNIKKDKTEKHSKSSNIMETNLEQMSTNITRDICELQPTTESNIERIEKVQQNVQKETQVKVEEKVPEAPTGIKSKASGLPLDNASEAWMNDDVGIIDSDSEDEAIQGDIGDVENKENVQQERQIKVVGTDTKESRNIIQDIVP